ncbi:excinuclease ABC subunit B, partial [Rhizobiaceae sp. 2RAB30]
RTVGDESGRKSLFAKPSLDDMGPGTDMAKPAGKGGLFRKPDLDEMGGDVAVPANAVSRSLFKKQSHQEAHGSDFGIPGEGSLFRKNTLDEMTVRRTEKPVEGVKPTPPAADDARPVRRERAGIGSYEDPADDRQRQRRSRKSGRPGH